MGRTSCPACGATVDIAEDVDTGEKVPVEIHTDSSSEADRYRIVGHNPLRIQKVRKDAAGGYFPNHLFDCPGANAGRVNVGGS